MRVLLAPLLVAPLAALAAPDVRAPFEPAITGLPTSNNNETELLVEDGSFELLKRQGSTACATNYYACANLGAPGLCCPRTAICSADQRGQVACCPQGNACTGALGTNAPIQTASQTSTGSVPASTTDTFVQSNSANPTAHSTVPNQFYPFPYIPTTYTNAAACSSAYTSCQSDAASCTVALANGAQGVTVSAPNGGATITAVPSLGLQSAQSICQSLSSQGCYGLTVEACARFDGEGNAAMRERCAGYFMTAGVALGIAGQLLR